MLEALGGRKFIMGLLVVIAGCAMQMYSPKGLTPELVALLLGVSGGFSVTNMLATKDALKFSSQTTPAAPVNEEPEEQEPAPVSNSDIHARLNKQDEVQQAILQSTANVQKLLAAALQGK